MPLVHSITLALIFALFAGVSPARADVDRVGSPFYGEALFDFNQQKFFSSIVQLEKEIALGRLAADTAEANSLLGSLYLSYGLHRHAQNVFETQLETETDEKSRNLAWFYLAKIQYQRGYYQRAGRHLDKITSVLPGQFEDERLTLTALILLQLGDNPAAIEVLNQTVSESVNISYSRFNLAMAVLNSGDTATAIKLLSEASQPTKGDADAAALADRINVALGFQYLDQQQLESAQKHFDKVAVRGPYSNQALLGKGWAAFGLANYNASATAWGELVKRDASDTNVLEAYLALPYLLYQKRQYSDALAGFKRAIEIYQQELDHIDQQLSYDDFSGLVALLVDMSSDDEMGWRWHHEVLEGPLLNHYMLRFVSGHEFQESLKNYRDLLFVAKNLRRWSRSMDVYADIIEVKAAAYAELRPRAQRRLQELSDNNYAAAIDSLKGKLEVVEQEEDAFALLNPEEQGQYDRLRSIDYRLSYNLDELDDKLSHLKVVQNAVKLLKHHDRLDGLFRWEVMTSYKQRLWNVKKNLKQLEAEQRMSEKRQRDIQEIIRTVPESFDSHRQRLSSLQSRLHTVAFQVENLLQEYDQYLQAQIKAELLAVRESIDLYRSQALLSVAHILDLNLRLSEVVQ